MTPLLALLPALGGTAAAAGAGTAAAGGIAGALASAAPYLTLGSGIVGATAAIASGEAQQAALDRNAAIERINAGSALAQAEGTVAQQQDQARRRVASATAAAAGDGTDIASGSPLDVMANISAESALDSEITRWKGAQASGADLTQASTDIYAGSQAATAGYLTAGTTLLTTAGRAGIAMLPPSGRAI